AKDIKELINSSSSQVEEGVELVNRAGQSLTEIVGSIKKVADIVSEIASASAEQATGIDQVNTALSQLDEVTQQNSALVEENAASAKPLEEASSSMQQRVSEFRLPGSAGGAVRQEPAAKAPAPVAPKGRAAPIRRKPMPQTRGALAIAAEQNADWQEF